MSEPQYRREPDPPPRNMVRSFWESQHPDAAAGVAGVNPSDRKDPLAQYLACAGWPEAWAGATLVFPRGTPAWACALPWWAVEFQVWALGFQLPRPVTNRECLE